MLHSAEHVHTNHHDHDVNPTSTIMAHDHNHDHGHSHAHPHTQSHDHSHSHSHDDHDHDHDHSHSHNLPVLGVIHVTASRAADLEDVRQRTVDFLKEKGMDTVVQVEREGEGRCWCGGGPTVGGLGNGGSISVSGNLKAS